MRNALFSAGLLLVFAAAQPAFADGDAAAGEKVFARCKACHTIEAGGPNRVGPNLHGIVGAPAGEGRNDYKFSKGMHEAGEKGLTWTEDNLRKWLANPREFVKGTKMIFPGIKSDKDMDNIIAYLKANS
ncbi:cytochrome c [Tistlia consotensis]|uniref:Cytochrome c n=2 Tax=Tistlia TaxID=1321364 RepID=A0A1Y6B802_9PROT|nr:cytochrome c family protein [Tistlia consotensis]SME89029.1 cytochrome c [Tistlia consotensis USBA 355]SNR25601.1 cytochrome c [Tistlia consotensis]